MGCCCSKDLDDKRSWSPDEAKNGSTTSTIIAQPMDNEVGGTGVFTLTRTTTQEQQQQTKVVTTTTNNDNAANEQNNE
ncbi:uncharacterized protein LOC115627422 [Scaptodrosophila lebanonensis]|uniref:Uncharacterized protein LOC115627422 n=1 Tax=Drosophila lebanonensis TaxID=7225 RepID=A0A6J2TQJ6_DROLE|nr:uncharacterized protein LOC115627422 [Scaptodrosophila lebanonensis]